MPGKRILAAAAFFSLSFFLAVSFVTYDGVRPAPEQSPVANLGGAIGKSLSDVMLKNFGAGSFAVALFLLFVGYSLLARRPLQSPLVKCVGLVVTTLVLSTTLQAIDPSAGYAASSFLLGGLAGDLLSSSLLDWFGAVGTTLILTLLLVAGLILASDTLLIEIGRGFPEFGRSTIALLRRLRRPELALAGTSRGPAPATEVQEEIEIEIPRKKRTRRKGAEVKEDIALAAATSAADIGDDVPPPTMLRSPGRTADPLDLDLDGLDDLLASDPIVAPPLLSTEEAGRRRKRGAKDKASAMTDVGDEFALDSAFDGIEALDLDREDDLSLPTSAAVAAPDDFDEEIDDDLEILAAASPSSVTGAPRVEPLIRRGGVRLAAEGIEILTISREKHLEGREPYELPPLSLLDEIETVGSDERDAEIKRKAHKLEETLRNFGIDGRVVEISRGPTITVYEIELAAGTKVKRITALPDDISMALKAKTIRIVAPIPGKSTVGIEVPNELREKVTLRELALSDVLVKKQFKIPLFLGKDAAGDPLIEDLTSMPHLLIAGQTGSGKSVCINSVIASLLLTKYPEEVRLILIDPKMVELQAFHDVPHLLTPVVTDMKKAPKVLDWAVNEMEQRYELLAAAAARDIERFNALGVAEIHERLGEHFTPDEVSKMPTSLPYVVVIVDELADLMMTSAKEVETSICRLAQKSRAVGIHVILATQRPSVDVITGLIKSNMPSRISFRVASKIDSRTILDQMGAERLLGKGDMLFIAPRAGAPTRCQAALVSDKEIKNLVRYVKDVARAEYSRELTQVPTSNEVADIGFDERDALYEDAVRAVLASQRGSVSMLQRKLEIGYTRAARLVDFMAEDGIVGNFKGSKAREVLMTLEDWEAQRAQGA